MQAARLGLLFGLVHWGILLLWIPLVMGPVFPWAYPAYGVLLGVLGGLMAIMAWAVHRLHHSVGVPMAVAFPLGWVGMEWLRGHLPFGFSFPWLGLSLTLTEWPELLALAEWAGESGAAFWLATVNGMLAGMVLKVRDGTDWRSRDRGGMELGFSWGRAWGLVALVILLPAGLSLLRFRTLPMQAGPRVAVVGTYVPREVRLDPRASLRESREQVGRIIESLEPGSVDLVLLPESVIPVPLSGSEAASFRSAVEEWAKTLQATLVMGALEVHQGGSGVDSLTNSAFLVSPDGVIRDRYDKSHLVPGMERGSYHRGTGGSPLQWRELTLGPLICYESLFPGLSRRHGRKGAQILVNLTSDVWFGDNQGRARGIFLHQHPAHLVLRAVENRMSVARSANGGYSLLLDPLGRTLSAVVPPEGGLSVAMLPIYPGTTLFSRTGDLVGPASALMVLLLLVWAGRPGKWHELPPPA
jgi:apolipoprotein N-acyltransferase